ncbi:hypothetical protein NEAUS03_2006 [Nematocida ausubeli]|nr:hypothetical protein NEAUS03_2006 [Nematocida ausubeli]
MNVPKKTALRSLHNIVEELSGILHKISEQQEVDGEISRFVQSVEDLKGYFEEIDCTECPPGQDLGIGSRSILSHLEDN